MRHLLRMPTVGTTGPARAAASVLACVLPLGIATAVCACSKKSSAGAADAAPAAIGSIRPASSARGTAQMVPGPGIVPIDHTPIWLRDSGTRIPLITPIPYTSSGAAAAITTVDGGVSPAVLRAPDWDLAADDPARDYVRRYVIFTRRYPDPECADIGPSVPTGDVKQVTVRTAATCPGGGTVRDIFLVDTAGDHLTVDDKAKRNPLARWPDGSDPESPPGAVIRETTDMKAWKSPLRDALVRLSLAPLRMQSYGRGTYPLVSVAAWRAPYTWNAPADAMKPLSDALCAANDNMPMALVAGFDRAHVLRVRCPSSTKWDMLQ